MPTRNEVRARVVQILVKEFDVDPAKAQDGASFRGTFVMDSTDVVDFITLIENEFGLAGEVDGYQTLHTLGDLVDYLVVRLREVGDGR